MNIYDTYINKCTAASYVFLAAVHAQNEFQFNACTEMLIQSRVQRIALYSIHTYIYMNNG